MKRTGLGRYLVKEQWWRAVMDRQRASGLSIRGFCRGEKLSEPSFYAWRRELLRRDRESPGVRRSRSARSLQRPPEVSLFVILGVLEAAVASTHPYCGIRKKRPFDN